MASESVQRTLTVALVLCIVCAVVVSSAAVILRPTQEENKLLDLKTNILASAGLLQVGVDVEKQYDQISTRVVDLETGRFTDAIDPATFDQRKSSKDPAMSTALDPSEDLAKIKRRENYATVYIVEGEQGAGLVDDVAHLLGSVVADDGVPAQLAAVLDDEIEKGVHFVHAAFGGHIGEALADQRCVRRLDDVGIAQIAVPDAGAEALLVVLAEALAVFRIAHQLVALQLIGQMQHGLAGAEFLEDDEINAVREDLELRGQRLPAEVRAEEAIEEVGEETR